MFKKLMGLGGEGKQEGETEVNRSMYVSSSKDKKQFSPAPPHAKEDPGPLKSKMTSHKRTIVKNVSENQKKADSKGPNAEETESTLLQHEVLDRSLATFFELTPEELTADLTKSAHYEIIKDAIEYLHKNGSLIQKLENQEKGLKFPLCITTKEESELVFGL